MTSGVPFVGRAREVEAVRDAVRTAESGAGRSVIVEGIAGIGKSRLLQEAIVSASDELEVVHLAGSEVDAHRPFGPFASLLRRVESSDGSSLAAVVERLIRQDEGAPGDAEHSADSGYRAREALVEAFSQQSRRRPTVVVADDLHWFDSASIACIARLASLTRDHAISVVVATRPGTRPARLERALSDMRRDGALTLALGGLPNGEVAELVEALVGSPIGPRLAGDLAALQGSPMLAVEVITALRADKTLRRRSDGRVELARGERLGGLAEASLAIGQSVEALGPAVVELLQIAAVIGTRFTLDDWCLLAGRAATDLAQPSRVALDAGILVEEAGILRFRHDLVREVLYGQLPEAARRGLHRHYARVLADAGRPPIDAAPHLVRGAAVGDGEAIGWLHEAARHVGPLAPSVALELIEHALALAPGGLPDVGPIHADRALMLLWSGRFAEGEAACRHVLAAGLDPQRADLLHRMLLRSMLTRGRAAEAVPTLQAAITATPPDSPQQAGFRAALAFALLNLGDHERALDVADEAIRLATTGSDAFTISEAYHSKAQVLFDAGRVVESAQMADEAFAHLRATTLPGGTQNLTATAAFTLARMGRATEAVQMATDGLAANRARGAAQGVALHHSMLAEIRYLTGDWDAALDDVQASEQIVGDAPAWPVASYGTMAMIALHRGELEAAGRAVADSYAAVRDGHGPLRAYRAELAEALLVEANGGGEQALPLFRRVWERLRARGAGVGYHEIAPPVVRRLVDVGDFDGATHVANVVRECAGWNAGVEAVEAAAVRCEGLVTGDVEQIVAAVDAYESSQLVLDSALAAEDAARAYTRLDKREPAIEMLERAAEHHGSLRAQRGIERVAAALRALGVRRRRLDPIQLEDERWSTLTPRERVVARLVAQRMTNKEIAERLYLSRRTVETHVSRVLSKLDLRSRAEVAAAAARLGGDLPE